MEVILMRHGESLHNVAKKQIKSKLSSDSVKESAEYKAIRINPSYRDQTLTQSGILEAQNASALIDWEQVQVILVSPMKRCLETCKKVLQKSKKKMQVFVQPLLKGRLSNIWGHGSPVQDLKILYPLYNFNKINDSSQLPWFIKIMTQQKQEQYKNLKNRQDQLYQTFKQDYFQFKHRVSSLKPIIDDYVSQLAGNKKILIISHSCVLRTLTANEFNKKGKSVSSIKFNHVSPVCYKTKQILTWCEQGVQNQSKAIQI